ncbi:DUF4435 domain-containing protein [Candidatus Poribacteria bacterium]|nr:DUF4435 domain-containing protein [Candidatus Poribacteria bacterium]
MSFSRTDEGLAAEHRFYQNIVVYVEGFDDKPFYEEILNNYDIEIIEKNGRKVCEKLATILVESNSPFVVILDGDYKILKSTRSQHRRVVLLHRYSFENYLFEHEPIEQFCRDHKSSENRIEKLAENFRTVLEETRQKFEELIILDVAHQRAKTGYDVLPEKSDRFFKKGKKVDFLDSQIEQYTEAAKNANKQHIDDATVLVKKYLKEQRFIDLLPGHFAFGIMRRLIVYTVGKSISNDEIRIYLSRMVWQLVKTPDHDSLKRRLRNAVREVDQMRQERQ